MPLLKVNPQNMSKLYPSAPIRGRIPSVLESLELFAREVPTIKF